jgi:3-deoxy-D-manno-octulosonate 8-phosphate phosphatase (KDO 8-P phosphatase)
VSAAPAARRAPPRDVIERAARIALLVLDVDGVLTDGRLYLGDNGVEYKTFSSRDGHGIKLLMSAGVQVGVITGRRSQLVEQRMAALGVTRVHQGDDRKRPIFERMLAEIGIDASQAAYVGDDLVDLPVMRACGLSIAVADADPRVVARAHWCTVNAGGRGAVREVCELLLEARGALDAALAHWLDDAP